MKKYETKKAMKFIDEFTELLKRGMSELNDGEFYVVLKNCQSILKIAIDPNEIVQKIIDE